MGGAAYAVRQIERGKSGSISSQGWTVRGPGRLGGPLGASEMAAAPDGSFSVAETVQADGTRLLVSTSKRGAVNVTVSQVVRPASTSPFRQALASLSGMRLGGALLSDGYDSALGSYAGQVAVRDGGVTAGADTGGLLSNGSISLAKGSVFGRVGAGPSGALDPGLARISGATMPLSKALVMPELAPGSLGTPASSALAPGSTPVLLDTTSSKKSSTLSLAASVKASSGSVTDSSASSYAPPASIVISSGTTTLAAGVYDVGEVSISGAVVHVSGEVVLRARTRFEIGAGGSIVIDQGGSLRVEADGTLDIGGDGILNLTGPATSPAAKKPGAREGDPTRLTIVALTDPATAPPLTRIATPTPFFGALYAPGRPLAIEASLTLHGAAIVGSVSTDADVALHFDAALARTDLKGGGATTYEVAATWSAGQ
jgi:hypothetical protein